MRAASESPSLQDGRVRYHLEAFLTSQPLILTSYQPWLYNLEVDPTESYPMNKHHPELVEGFIQKMAQWQKQMEADPKGFNGEAKR